jgi:hypothetical protein
MNFLNNKSMHSINTYIQCVQSLQCMHWLVIRKSDEKQAFNALIYYLKNSF